MGQANLEVEAELGRSLPDDFHTQVYAEIFELFAASLEATPHIDETLTATTLPVCVASSGPPQKNQRLSPSRWIVRPVRAAHFLRRAGAQWQAGARSVSACCRTDGGIASAMPRDRGQRGRRRRRARCRHDRTRLSRRQPLPTWLRRQAARRRRRHDVRRHAAIA
jgi:hypothetical protein